MDTSQIIRMPKKYKDLIYSMSNEQAGILFKKSFGINIEGDYTTELYFGFIRSDLENLEKSAINGIKGKDFGVLGGRPRKNPPGVENENPPGKPLKGSREEVEIEIEEEVELLKVIKFWNDELHRKYEITKELKDVYIKIVKKYDKEIREDVIFRYIQKCKKMDKQYHLSPYKFFTQKNGFISIKNS